jgi:hypothetical protein
VHHRFSIAVLAALLALAAASAAEAADPAGVILSPPEWDFGTIAQGEEAALTLVVSNTNAWTVSVLVTPTCDCSSVQSPRQEIPAGSRAEFHLSYRANADDVGAVRKEFLIRVDGKSRKRFLYAFNGIVTGDNQGR